MPFTRRGKRLDRQLCVLLAVCHVPPWDCLQEGFPAWNIRAKDGPRKSYACCLDVHILNDKLNDLLFKTNRLGAASLCEVPEVPTRGIEFGSLRKISSKLVQSVVPVLGGRAETNGSLDQWLASQSTSLANQREPPISRQKVRNN